MANTVFQIRRNSTSGVRPTTASFAVGELALNTTDGILFSTDGSRVFEIGANNTNRNTTGNAFFVNVYSTGTINAAVYTVGTSFVANTIQTTFGANVKINTGISIIDSTGSQGTTGQVLTSNGTGNVYWSSSSGGGATLNANNTDTQTYYPAMSNNTTGSWSNAVIATSKFYFVPSTGTLSATIFTSLSDKNAKTNIQIITSAVDTLKRINGVSFNWLDNNKKSYGVIAQDIEKVLPDLVEENSGIKSVNYLGIIGYLIEAVKELDTRLNDLENR